MVPSENGFGEGFEGMKGILQTLIRLYAFLISPLLGNNCRFYPTCSCYAQQALEHHGVIRGSVLAFIRILKCNPWSSSGGPDPVPDRFAWRAILGYKRVSGHHQKTNKERVS